MRQTELQPSPEESFQQRGQFKQGLGLSILIALGMVSGIWLARDWVAPPPPAPEAAQVVLQGVLEIETEGVTYVFINGSAQRQFSNARPISGSIGDATLEFQHEKFGSLKSRVQIRSGQYQNQTQLEDQIRRIEALTYLGIRTGKLVGQSVPARFGKTTFFMAFFRHLKSRPLRYEGLPRSN